MRTTSIAQAVFPGSLVINSCFSIIHYEVHLSTDASEIKEHHKDDTVVHVSNLECACKHRIDNKKTRSTKSSTSSRRDKNCCATQALPSAKQKQKTKPMRFVNN